jgi:hypothetical protein
MDVGGITYRLLRGTRAALVHILGFKGGRCEMDESRISTRLEGLQTVLHRTARQTIRIYVGGTNEPSLYKKKIG